MAKPIPASIMTRKLRVKQKTYPLWFAVLDEKTKKVAVLDNTTALTIFNVVQTNPQGINIARDVVHKSRRKSLDVDKITGRVTDNWLDDVLIHFETIHINSEPRHKIPSNGKTLKTDYFLDGLKGIIDQVRAFTFLRYVSDKYPGKFTRLEVMENKRSKDSLILKSVTDRTTVRTVLDFDFNKKEIVSAESTLTYRSLLAKPSKLVDFGLEFWNTTPHSDPVESNFFTSAFIWTELGGYCLENNLPVISDTSWIPEKYLHLMANSVQA